MNLWELLLCRWVLTWGKPLFHNHGRDPWKGVKENSDGAMRSHDNMVAASGLIRDSRGNWIFGFTRSLGRCSILVAELWVVHDILMHA
ncbi:hypothetical protein HRI_004499500 [Hibiscus trionum]|uniref:RNase H type-1 domain-containing protein n=1 Tax=Hibiscus trionum TaxID=183268 RepID=A0A9W7MKM6_HIBTR|nr:hypothetical protein HRI_004499500 [Hibiscus trionum]